MQRFLRRVFEMHPLALITGACLIALTIPTYRLIDAQRQNVGAIPAAINKQGADTRAWVKADVLDNTVVPELRKLGSGIDGHGKDLEAKLDNRLGSIENGILARYDTLEKHTNERVGDFLEKGSTALQTTAGALKTTAEGVRPLLTEARGAIADMRPGFQNGALMVKDVRDAVAPNLECKGNGSCWPAKTTAILGGVATAVGEGGLIERAWRKEAPATAANVRGITGNAEKLSHPHWYTKWAPAAAGVVIAILGHKK